MPEPHAMKDRIPGCCGDSDDSAAARPRRKKAHRKQRTNASLTPDNSQQIYTAVQSLFWITYGLMFAFASLYLQNRGFSNSAIGLTLGCSYALSAVMQPVLSRLFIRLHVPTERAISGIFGIAIVFSVFLLMISAWAWFAKSLLIWFADRPEFIYIAEILQFCSYGLYIPAIVQFVASIFPGREHLIGQAFVGSAYTAGSVIATFLGGKLLDAAGVSAVLPVIAAATLTGAVLFTVSIMSYRKSG